MSHKTKLRIGCILVVGTTCVAACNSPVDYIGEPAGSGGGGIGTTGNIGDAVGDPIGLPAGSGGGNLIGGDYESTGGTMNIGSDESGGSTSTGGAWHVGAPPLGGYGGEAIDD